MNILLANKFFYNRGGAERWIFEVDRLLRDHGHETSHFSMKDPQNASSSWCEYFSSPVSYEHADFSTASFKAIQRMFYSEEVRRSVERLVEKSRPDVALLGNVYHQLGPTLISTLSRLGIPMVMMLHDFKLVCPSYLMFRNGQPCEKCAHGRFFWSAFHGCGGSLARGWVLALESYWQKDIVKSYSKIRSFVSPSHFLGDKSKTMGFKFPIHYVPNFVAGSSNKAEPSCGNAVGFAGRISPEKGVDILVEAAALMPSVPVRIAGTGPLLEELKQNAPDNVSFLGQLDKDALTKEMLTWRAMVVPSLWYENSPYSILEAMAIGLPVIGSDSGGISELLKGWGVVFPAGDARALAHAIRDLWENPDRCRKTGEAGRGFVSKEHSAELFLAALMPILEGAVHPQKQGNRFFS